MYEIIPAGEKVENTENDQLRYSKHESADAKFNDELLTVKLRYKRPDENTSQLLSQGLLDRDNKIENASDNLRFASSVAEFGLMLRNSEYKGNSDYEKVGFLAKNSLGSDLKNYRKDFLDLIYKAKRLQ